MRRIFTAEVERTAFAADRRNQGRGSECHHNGLVPGSALACAGSRQRPQGTVHPNRGAAAVRFGRAAGVTRYSLHNIRYRKLRSPAIPRRKPNRTDYRYRKCCRCLGPNRAPPQGRRTAAGDVSRCCNGKPSNARHPHQHTRTLTAHGTCSISAELGHRRTHRYGPKLRDHPARSCHPAERLYSEFPRDHRPARKRRLWQHTGRQRQVRRRRGAGIRKTPAFSSPTPPPRQLRQTR